MELLLKFLSKNGLLLAFAGTAFIILFSQFFAKNILKNKIPATALAVMIGLVLAYIGGHFTGGKNGIADIPAFAGFNLMGGSMLRDFTIVATAMGVNYAIMRQAGWVGFCALLVGITTTFIAGVIMAYVWGYTDVVSMTTIGAGACTYIVGPVTGAALGASSDVIALSIAAGVIKAIGVAIGTPFLAKYIGLDNPRTAMIFGGMIGTNTGVMAGLAATDPKLIPYGALTATFYTGLGCLLCPSVFYLILQHL